MTTLDCNTHGGGGDTGRVVHFELPADDPNRVVAYYEKAFGWDIRKRQGPMDYWLMMTSPQEKPGIDGAVMQRQGPATVVRNWGWLPPRRSSLRRASDESGRQI